MIPTRVLASLLVGLALAAPLGAQEQPPEGRPCPQCIDVPGWVGQFTVLSGNVLLGGLTAGLIQEFRGGSFQDGFARGAMGGAAVYLGKRVAVEEFDGAGLLGRQVAAVGSSVVRNASDGRPSFERLIFPLGLLRLHVDGSRGWQVTPSLDATATVTTLYGLAEPKLRFDLGESLSAGAPVFHVDEQLMASVFTGEEASGVEVGFNIFLSDIERFGAEYRRRVFAHERVHVIQGDFFFTTLSDPLVDPLIERLPGGARIRPHIDLDVSDFFVGALSATVFPEYRNRPWELEAEWLGRGL